MIELFLGSESKSTKVYSLFSVDWAERTGCFPKGKPTYWIDLSMVVLVLFVKKKNSSLQLM